MIAAKPKPSIYHFNILLSRIHRMKNPSHHLELLSLFTKMNRAGGVSPDCFTCGLLIDCCTRTIFGIMLRRGCQGNFIVIFNTLVKGLCTEGRITEATHLFDRMPQWGCSPDLVTCTTLIRGLCSVKSTTMALKFLREMASKPNVVTYNTIIDAFCKEDAMDKASELFEEMPGSGVQPDVFTYNSLLHGYSAQGCLRESIRVFKEMVDKGPSPDAITFNTLIHTLCKQGATNEAHKLFNLMVERGEKPNVIDYTTLLHRYCLESVNGI